MKVALDGGAPEVVATAQTLPGAVSVGADSVSWLNAREVMTASLEGGTPVEIAQVSLETFCGPSPPALHATATDLYWIRLSEDVEDVEDDGCTATVETVPIAGGASTLLADGHVHPGSATHPGSPMVFALGGGSIYWWDEPALVMRSRPLGGGAHTTIAAAGAVSAVAIDGSTLFWIRADNGEVSLLSAPAGGGVTATALATLEDGDVYTSIAVDAARIYWMRPGVEVATVVRVDR
jgi:hypothetical protein